MKNRRLKNENIYDAHIMYALMGVCALAFILGPGAAIAESTLNNAVQIPMPIEGASGWELSASVSPANICSVRHNGDQVDISVTIGEKGQYIVTAGKPDWEMVTGMVKARIRFDDHPEHEVMVGSFRNIYIWNSLSESEIDELRHSSALTWALPAGSYRAEIYGVSAALTALGACNQRKH